MDYNENKQEKKKYWLKLDKDFLRNPQMKVLKNMTNGKDYIIFYLSLMLESIETVGHLRFTSLVPYNDEMLSAVTDTNIDIVRSAVKLFCELGLMQIFDDGTIFMPEVPKMTGKESESAERVRNYRERIKKQKDISLLQCNNDVTKCNDNKEKQEYKDKQEEKNKQENKEIPEGGQMSDKRPPNIDININKKKKTSTNTEIDKVVNEKIQDEEVKEAFYDFIKMRKAIKKPLTTRGVELAIQKLYKLSNVKEEQILILNNSIMNNWQGLFELKPEDKKQLEQPKEYKEINLSEEEYIKQLDERGKRYV